MGTMQTMQVVMPCGVIYGWRMSLHMGPADELEEELQALDMEGNIMGDDFAEWSEYDDTHEVHSVQKTPRRER